MKPAGRLVAPTLFALLVLGTLAAFVVVEDERDHPQIIGDDKVSNTFKPQGSLGEKGRRRMLVTFTVTRAEPHASVVVVDSAGEVVRTLADDVHFADDSNQRYLWDGRRDDGEPAAAGRYRVHVLLKELDRDLPLDGTRLQAPESDG